MFIVFPEVFNSMHKENIQKILLAYFHNEKYLMIFYQKKKKKIVCSSDSRFFNIVTGVY